jgi:hypothetical protein
MIKKVSIQSLIPLVVLALLACSGSGGKAEKEKVVATVNGAAITATELQQEVEGYGKVNPVSSPTVDHRRQHLMFDDQLQQMIEHKILIQEAVKMGLNEDKEFVQTIKTFWEQTIIRNLIEAKTEQLSEKSFVSDQEISTEYERMKIRPRIRAMRGLRTEKEADDLALQMQSGHSFVGEETIGPLLYEDVKGSPLANAFDMKVGQVKKCDAGDEHIVIIVTDQELMKLPPLKELSNRIKGSILAQKRQKALQEWIATVKENASIQIDEKELRRIGNE